MQHRRFARQVHAHAYLSKQAQKSSEHHKQMQDVKAPDLPTLPDSSQPTPSPFPGGKPLAQNQHTIAEDLHDWVLGGQDGVVNVLGTMLGVAVVTQDKTILIVTGLASAAAESLSMAAVAFTSVRASQSYYESEMERQRRLIEANPFLQREVLIDVYVRKGMSRVDAQRVVTELTRDKTVWLETLMEQHLRLSAPEKVNPSRSAFIVGTASVFGSLIPVIPFFFLVGYPAIFWALGTSAVVLFAGGALSAKLTIGDWKKRGLEMVTIAMIAALAGFAIGWIFTRGVVS